MLEVFSKHFHKIYILVPKGGYSRKVSSYKLPENCLVVQFDLEIPLKDRIFHRPYWLTTLYFREFQLFGRFNKEGRFRALRENLFFLKKAKYFKKVLSKFISGSHLPGSRTYFYSANFSSYLLGAVRFSRKNKLAGVFSETTHWGNKVNRTYSPFRSYMMRYLNGLFFLSDHSVDSISYLKPGTRINGLMKFAKGVNPFPSKPAYSPFRLISYGLLNETTGVKSIVDALDLINTGTVEWIHFGEADDVSNLRQYAFNHLFNKSNIQFKFLHPLSPGVLTKWLSENSASLYISLDDRAEQRMDTALALTAGIPAIVPSGPHTADLYGDCPAVRFIDADSDADGLAKMIREFLAMPEEQWMRLSEAASALARERFLAEENYNQMVYHILQMGNANHA